MKRIVCLLAAVLLVCAMMPVATAEGDVTLRLVGNLQSAQVGDTVTVTAVAENAPDCTAYELIFSYDDTVLKPVLAQAVDTEGFSNFNTEFYYDNKPAVKASAVDPSFCFSGNAVLATFTFEILAETPGYYGTPITIRYSSFTKDHEGMQAGLLFGTARKNGRVYVGADEVLSTAQAVEILRHLIGIPSENEEHLDWNGDGVLSVADAVLLLRELN